MERGSGHNFIQKSIHFWIIFIRKANQNMLLIFT